jgi:hypothetical protein
MTVLAVPGTIPKSEIWNEIALRCMILDRIRLAGLVTNSADIGRVGLSVALLDAVRPHLLGSRD